MPALKFKPREDDDMRLLVSNTTAHIHAATNSRFDVPTGFTVVTVSGDADTYDWPNGLPQKCLYQNGTISANSDYKDTRYMDSRRAAYGEWGDQLDEIFHDIDAWRSRISAVKAAHPKPE